MLLSDCLPLRRVLYHRAPFTFTANIVTVTPRGNVVVCAFLRDGLRMEPLFLSLRPERIERAPTGTERVGQTAAPR
jgi:hypothetical protein